MKQKKFLFVACFLLVILIFLFPRTTVLFSGLSVEDIDTILYWDINNSFSPLNSEDKKQMINALQNIRMFKMKSNKWRNLAGGSAQFQIMWMNGSKCEVIVLEPYLIVNQVGYRCTHSSSSALRTLDAIYYSYPDHMICG